MSATFLLTSLIVVLLPGPGVVYTLATAISRGHRAGLLAALASTIGVLPHLLLAVTGLAAVLTANPVLFDVIRYAGVGYLLYLAWQTFRDRSELSVDDEDPGQSVPPRAGQMMRAAITMNLLNPKLTVFFVAFLPQFVPAGSGVPVLAMLGLGGVFVLMTFAVFALYSALAASVRTLIQSRPRINDVLRTVFAVSFVGLAAKLALT